MSSMLQEIYVRRIRRLRQWAVWMFVTSAALFTFGTISVLFVDRRSLIGVLVSFAVACGTLASGISSQVDANRTRQRLKTLRGGE